MFREFTFTFSKWLSIPSAKFRDFAVDSLIMLYLVWQVTKFYKRIFSLQTATCDILRGGQRQRVHQQLDGHRNRALWALSCPPVHFKVFSQLWKTLFDPLLSTYFFSTIFAGLVANYFLVKKLLESCLRYKCEMFDNLNVNMVGK